MKKTLIEYLDSELTEKNKNIPRNDKMKKLDSSDINFIILEKFDIIRTITGPNHKRWAKMKENGKIKGITKVLAIIRWEETTGGEVEAK